MTQKSGRDKKVEWRGGVALDKGAVLAHTPYALDQYDDEVTRVSNKVLRFATATSGDPDGVLIDLDAPADARLSFFSNVKSFEIPLADISAEPTIIEAGGVNIRVLVAEVGATLKDWSARFQFTDEDPDGLQVTFVVKGNIYFSDDLTLKDSAKDGFAFICRSCWSLGGCRA